MANKKLIDRVQNFPLVPVKGEAEMLISQAINQNIPVEALERLLAMRRELKAEKAKEEYDKAMAAFQADCPTIQKTKEVKTSSGQVAYRYAPIESIVNQVKEQLRDNGFSYSTNMELLPDGVKVSLKVTHAHGHSEITTMSVPFGNKTQVMSQTQVVAAAQTFAKRYAFCNAFGILTGDEDIDARPIDNGDQPITPRQMREQIQSQQAASNSDYASSKQVNYIHSLLREKHYRETSLLKKYNIQSLVELTREQASEVIEKLNETQEEEIDLDEAEKAIEQKALI